MLEQIFFAAVAFIGGLISVPLGGSFLFVIPAFLFLGLDGISTILLGRVMMIGSMAAASAEFLRTEKFEFQKITKFLAGNLAGFFVAAKFLSTLDADAVTKIVPWILFFGAIFLLKNFKVESEKWKNFYARTLPIFGFLMGFYGGLGGGGNGKIILLLFSIALSFEFKSALVQTRFVEFFGNIFAVGAYFFFGAKATGFEIPVLISAAIGGFLGAKIVLQTKPKFLKFAFLILVLISAVKVTFFNEKSFLFFKKFFSNFFNF